MERLYKFRAIFKCLTEYEFNLPGDTLVSEIYTILKRDLKINIGLHVKVTCCGRQISLDKDHKISELMYFINDDSDGDENINRLDINMMLIGNMDDYIESDTLMFDYNDAEDLEEITLDKNLPDEDPMVGVKMKCGKILKKEIEKRPVRIPLLVTLNVNDIVSQPKTFVDLVYIIDKSLSMYVNIKLVVDSIEELLNSLSDKDRLCLVEFNDKAGRLCPMTIVNNENKDSLKQILNGICANGGTNIGEGLKHGLETIVQRNTANSVTSVLLLTDGQDDSFTEQQYSKIIGKIDMIMQKKGLDTDYIINTIGLGSGINSSSLCKMCNLKQGDFYFILDHNKIKENFKDCLNNLQNTICKKLTLDIIPQSGIKIVKINSIDGIFTQDSSGKYTIKLTNVPYNRQFNFLLEVEIDKQNSLFLSKMIKKGIPIAKCNGKMEGLMDYGYPIINFSADCAAEITDNPTNMENEILIHQKRIEFTNIIKSAIILCSNSEEGEAVEIITKFIQELEKLINSASFSKDIKNKTYLESLLKEATKVLSCAGKFYEGGNHYMMEIHYTLLKEKNSSAGTDLTFRQGRKGEGKMQKSIPKIYKK